MKTLLKFLISAAVMLLISQSNFAQAPTLGTTANFVLFSSNGAVSHTGLSQITGNVGTNNGSSTNFGNVNGNMHDQNPASAQASTDLLTAYNQIAAVTANFFVASPLGNGDTLVAGTYSLGAASTLNGILTLDAENDPSAIFIIRVMGSLSSAANTKVNLINGGQACNVYWQIEGLLSIASGTVLRGTFIVNNAAITMSTNDTIEGRLLTTTGGITVDNLMAYTPIGCGSPVLTGPSAPALGAAGCFGIFSSVGDVTNAGITFVTGDVGTQIGSTVGFDSLNITGKLHLVQDTTTAAANAALGTAYTALNTLSHDIELMAPAAFGNNLVLTPHTYLLNAMTVFTDSLYLNAMGDSNAVFVIKINGALSTSTYAKVILINGARSKNVYWVVNGAVEINDYSEFKGTVVANNGAINAKIGVQVQGRLMTTAGAITTAAVTVVSPITCLAQAAVVITTEPIALQICAGDTAMFVVAASGSNLSYQWYRNNVLLVNSGSISGATNDTLTIFPAILANAGNYTVIVSDTSLSDTSVVAALTVTANTLITNEPADLSVCAGDSVNFSVVAQGDSLTYQWFRGTTALVTTAFVLGADSSTLVLLAANVSDIDSTYYVIVNGLCGAPDTSVMARLTVSTAATIATQPVDITACFGDTIQFSFTTAGSNPSVQWFRNNTLLNNGLHLMGADSTVMTIYDVNLSDATNNYYAVITSACGTSDTTDLVALVVNLEVNITNEPSSVAVCAGDSAVLSVIASGDGLTYQWYRGSTALVNSFFILGAYSSAITFLSTAAGNVDSNYYVVVSGLCGPADTSAMVTLSIEAAPTVVTQPVNQTICNGDTVRFSITTSAAANVQWYRGNTALTNSLNLVGADSTVMTFFAANLGDVATNYYAVVSGTCGQPDTSNFAALTVNVVTNITAEPINTTVCEGQNLNLSVVATGSALTYQWFRGNVAMTNVAGISGATTANLSIATVTTGFSGTNYYVVVTGLCGVDTSTLTTVQVNTGTDITTQPTSQIACIGQPASFSVVASGNGLTYQWRKGNLALVNGGTISGATGSTLTISAVSLGDIAANYSVIVNSICGIADTSVLVGLTVNSLNAILTEPIAQTVCVGQAVNLSVVAVGAGLTYQWRIGNTPLVNGGVISGATTATLSISAAALANAASNYNVIVNGLCGAPDTSISVDVVVNTAPVITTQPIAQVACVGANTSFTVVATGTGITYQWRKGSVNLTNTGNISGATTATLTLTGVNLVDAATDYNVLISGTCTPALASANVALQVNSLVQITTAPLASQTICAGSSISFTVVATGTGLTYQWRKGTVNLTNTGNVSGATSATLILNPVVAGDAATDYNVVVAGACAPQQISTNATLVVNALTAFVIQPTTVNVCEGSSASITASAVGTNLSYQWFKGGVALVNTGNISGSTTNTLVINPVTLADAAANYQLVVTGSCLPALSSNLVAVNVALPHLIVTQPSDTITNIGGSASFTVVDNGQGVTYQWRRGNINVVNGGNISGSQSATLQFSPATVADNGMDYNVVISGNCAADLRSINVALLVTEPLSVEEWLAKETPVVFYPNPFNTELNAMMHVNSSLLEADVQLYNSLGVMVLQSSLSTEQAMREQMTLPAGIYHYRVLSNGILMQSGKLISLQ